MDVFTTVVGTVIAGLALFLGYRVGLKDGFRGGFQRGRVLERQLAVEERRYLLSRVVQEEEPMLLAVPGQKALPYQVPSRAETFEDATGPPTHARVGPPRRPRRPMRRV